MDEKKPSDSDLLDLESGIPDLKNIRGSRPKGPEPVEDWWQVLTDMVAQFPNAHEVRSRRSSFVNFEPFEL
jgi:hypothetical protein